jgi:Flp pilus assembly pilin Flp
MTTLREKIRTFMFTIPTSIVWYTIAGIILYSAQMQFDFRNMSTYFWILAFIVPVFFIVSALVVSDGDNEDAFYSAFLFTLIASTIAAVVLAIVSTFGTNLYHAKSNFAEVASYVDVQKNGELAFPELIKDGDTSKLPLFGEQEAKKESRSRACFFFFKFPNICN